MREYDHLFKFKVMGCATSGKTCFILRRADDTYTDSRIETMGVDFKKVCEEYQGKPIAVQMWDRNQPEDADNISYYNQRNFTGLHAIIYTVDLTDHSQLENAKKHIQALKRCLTDKQPIILVGTKADHKDKKINFEALKAIATEFELLGPIETSAKNGSNVDKVVQLLVETTYDLTVAKKKQALPLPATSSEPVKTNSLFSEIFSLFSKKQKTCPNSLNDLKSLYESHVLIGKGGSSIVFENARSLEEGIQKLIERHNEKNCPTSGATFETLKDLCLYNKVAFNGTAFSIEEPQHRYR